MTICGVGSKSRSVCQAPVDGLALGLHARQASLEVFYPRSRARREELKRTPRLVAGFGMRSHNVDNLGVGISGNVGLAKQHAMRGDK